MTSRIAEPCELPRYIDAIADDFDLSWAPLRKWPHLTQWVQGK